MINSNKFNISYLLLFSTLFLLPTYSYGFKAENHSTSNSNDYRNTQSFLTGKLIGLTLSQVLTSVGAYAINASVTVTDNRKKDQKNSFVQLEFKNKQLIKLNIY